MTKNSEEFSEKNKAEFESEKKSHFVPSVQSLKMHLIFVLLEKKGVETLLITKLIFTESNKV